MEFATAVEKGFGVDRITLRSNGGATVSVGSSVEREEASSEPYENIEVLVCVPAVLAMTAGEIRKAALARAALVLQEAATVLAAQIQLEAQSEATT